MEQVAHGIDKNSPGRSPSNRIAQLFRHQPGIKTKFKGMAGNAAPALGKGFGVAMEAAGADFGAAAHGVPCRVRPFDFGLNTHKHEAPRLSALLWKPNQQLISQPNECRICAACQADSAGDMLIERR